MGGTCSGVLKRLGGHEYYCPVELALQVIGGKWKPLILYQLGDGRVMRFSELRKAILSITQKMLTQQLRELESDGVVERTIHAEVPPRVEYALTPFGRSVMPVMGQLCAWGSAYEAHIRSQDETAESAVG